MKKFYIILTLFLLNCNQIFASDWVEIAPKMYMNKSSYEYNPRTTEALVWIKALNHEGYNLENINGKRVWYELIYQKFNCSKKQLLTLSSSTYDLKGQVLSSYENPYQNYDSLLERSYRNIIPDSIGELWYIEACHPYLK